MKRYHLTAEQFALMQKYHVPIERSCVAVSRGEHDDFIDKLIASEEYKQLFGDMLWDEAYDRYEDTPGYDQSLKQTLKAQHTESANNRKISSAHDTDTDDLLSVESMRQIRDEERKKVKGVPSGK